MNSARLGGPCQQCGEPQIRRAERCTDTTGKCAYSKHKKPDPEFLQPHVINPDSTILQQVDGHWQKLAALILWKTSGLQKVIITNADIERFTADFAPRTPVIFTHGMVDSIGFQIVSEERANELAAYDKTQRGSA